MNRIIVTLLCLMTAPAWSATCKISEYVEIIKDASNIVVMVASEPAEDTQNVTYTSSTQSAAFDEDTKFIRVICDAKAHFVIGPNPLATAADPYLPADTPEYFGVGYQAASAATFEIAFYDGST